MINRNAQAEFEGKDQHWQDEKTVYWFELEGECFGIVEQAGEEPAPLFEDGHPIDCNEQLARRVLDCCTITDAMREA